MIYVGDVSIYNNNFLMGFYDLIYIVYEYRYWIKFT